MTGRQMVVVLHVFALVAVVVGVDVLFFRHQSWARLTVNAGIVLVFTAFYLRFLKSRCSRPAPRGGAAGYGAAVQAAVKSSAVTAPCPYQPCTSTVTPSVKRTGQHASG